MNREKSGAGLLMKGQFGQYAEPGRNPAFLYQQDSLRDALIAALTLTFLDKYCDCIKMANLAQTVNVLQALILQKKVCCLPQSYHVFNLFKNHMDYVTACNFYSPDYCFGSDSISAIKRICIERQ